MDDLALSASDFQHILRACAHVRLRHCTPEYLQDFLASRLDTPAPDLAVKVRQYSPAQMHDLCLLIVRFQGQGEN